MNATTQQYILARFQISHPNLAILYNKHRMNTKQSTQSRVLCIILVRSLIINKELTI